jgi:hypothetical protein
MVLERFEVELARHLENLGVIGDNEASMLFELGHNAHDVARHRNGKGGAFLTTHRRLEAMLGATGGLYRNDNR